MKKIIFIATALSLSLAAAPKLYTVGSKTSQSELSAVVYSKNESAISSKISGYVKKIYVEEGDSVKRGTPLFEIDATGTEAAAISANANYLSAKATAEDAKKDLERYKNLLDKGVVSEKEYERMKLNYEVKSQMLSSSSAMLKQARNEQGYSLVRAPMDGVVLKKYLTTASLAMPGQPVVLLSGKNDLRIRADVYVEELDNFKVGQTVSFKNGAKVVDAKVVSLTPSGANARNFSLRAEPLSQEGLYSGMFVKLLTKSAQGQLAIPVNTVTKRGGIVGVFEYASGIAKFKAVKIKKQNGDTVAVDGINLGMKLIENPKESLQDGQRVE